MLFVLLSIQLTSVLAGNILVLNHNLGHSHVRFIGNLADIYARDGHNVTILAPMLDETVAPFGTDNPNITKILFRSPYLAQSHWKKSILKSHSFWNEPEPYGQATDWTVWEAIMEAYHLCFKGFLEDKELIASLRATKFDLALTELFELGSLGVLEVIGARTTMVGAALGVINNHYEVTGLPNTMSFVPNWVTTFGDRMTFTERLRNLRAWYNIVSHEQTDRALSQELFRQYDPDFPDLTELAQKRIGVILTNSNEFTESPRPRTNMFQYVGGTNVHPPKPLNPEMDSLLSLRPSTVLFSFGTFIRGCQMPSSLKTEILEAFAVFPEVTFLWKHEDDCENDTAPFNEYPNVILRPWLPQTDLLGDKRLKAFVTHAGMNSMLESNFRGVPTVVIPLFGDQFVNAQAAVRIGTSVMIKRTELSRETLIAALKKVLDPNSDVSKKSQMAGKVLEGKGEEYRREALRWANLLIEYGPMSHHRLATNCLNLLQLYNIDCFALLLVTPVLILYALRKLYNFIARSLSVKRKSD